MSKVNIFSQKIYKNGKKSLLFITNPGLNPGYFFKFTGTGTGIERSIPVPGRGRDPGRSMFRSMLNYGCENWDGTCRTN